jgi:CDP-diacylglycerol--glycerol-3-phosphate 3-phosphatidyltransferase
VSPAGTSSTGGKREKGEPRELSEISQEMAERARRFGETAIKTPANVITFLRLLFAIPVLVWILDEGRATWGTFAGWMVLWLTDGIDGWLARRDGTTRSGAFLDPLADKILVLGGFIALAIRGDFAWVAVAIVVAREVFVSLYRTLEGRRGVSLPARKLGKWKATIQFFAVATVLFPPTADVGWLHDVALWAAVVLSIVSAVDLFAAARRQESNATVSDRPRDGYPGPQEASQ